MAKIIRVDGTTEEITDLNLTKMQAVVDGYIQIVPTPNGRLLVCDEEGKCKGKKVNIKASALYNNPYDEIVGDVILANNDEID